MLKSNGPFLKPERLDDDCVWVAVADVHRSDGAHPDEKIWGQEQIGDCSTERHALDAAVDWFNDTDQSEDCELTMSVERPDGTIAAHRVEVTVRPTARIKRPGGAA